MPTIKYTIVEVLSRLIAANLDSFPELEELKNKHIIITYSGGHPTIEYKKDKEKEI